MADAKAKTEEMIEHLSLLAELPLDADRRALIRDQLDGLLAEANRVNRFMDPRREVGIGVRFHHPERMSGE